MMNINDIKEIFSSWTIRMLAAFVIMAIILISTNGIRWGIDFVGGVRIPVELEKPVDKDTMNQLITKIKTRASGFGLSQVNVRAIGDNLIYVELPAGKEEVVDSVEKIITKQGVFVGTVDGRIALEGNSILQDTIRTVSSSELQNNKRSDWAVRFSLDLQGAKKFADTAKGKANRQIYMSLDRPSNFLLVIPDEFLENASSTQNSKSELILALYDAIKLDGDNSNFVAYSEFSEEGFEIGNYTTLIIDSRMNSTLSEELVENKNKDNITIKVIDSTTPNIETSQLGPSVSEWKAIGLLTSLTLSPEVTTGSPSLGGYILSGGVSEGNALDKAKIGAEKAKEIINILKSGSLPVRVTLGNKKYIPAPLGQRFLEYSIMALMLSVAFIAVFVGIRYRKLQIIIPVIIISIAEVIILVAIMGTFTIDLAGIAGLIAAIGVSVDAQIVITDELLKKDRDRKLEDRLKRAFEIITTNVTVAVASMLPLLFSGITEIVGFAVATILGSVLGLLLSRPAYSQIAKFIIAHEQ